MEKVRITSSQIQEFEKKHIGSLRKMAPECMVLLKNDGTLPLKKTGKIALYGNGARRTIKGGTGSGDVNVRHFVTVEEGLENAGFEITTKKWLDAYDRKVDEAKSVYFKELRRQADEYNVNPLIFAMGKVAPEPKYEFPLDGEGDTAIYVLARISGEGADRQAVPGDIMLTETEIRDILNLYKTYEHFILVLNTGGMVDLEPIRQIPVILIMGQLGTPSGDALADVLTGKAYPSGKLTMTWAPISRYASTEGFGDPDDTDYKEGIYIGYRYFNTFNVMASYPFGYGMGYTIFDIKAGKVIVGNGLITVTATVTNIGNTKGKEVVQVYYSAPMGIIDKPYQELAGYAKTRELSPGETDTLTITFAVKDMSSYDEKRAAWVLETGIYDILVGNSSENTHLAGSVSLNEEIITAKVKNISTADSFTDLKAQTDTTDSSKRVKERAGVEIQEIRVSDICCTEAVYKKGFDEIQAGTGCTWEEVTRKEKTLEEFVGGLTDEQLADLCIGEYKDTENFMEIIGNASSTVAGAAGETTSRLKELGVPAMIMADGPAGVRLSPEYTISEGIAKGSFSIGGDMFLVYTPQERAAMPDMASEKEGSQKEQRYYHYCAAIPIGTDIAQSWNDGLAEQCGDLVGEEMEQFGIHAWLAPALNIQRSPLCGRNFEYYSEDPFISGRMAASVTKGVQKHPGCAATIKHYACNNQETNRFFSNSNVSERAMREIYLKGFEICVKEAKPCFIMTSYNLINGEHACNSKNILTDVLRDEWGYEGVVMTDWLVTGGMGARGEKWPCASAAGNVKAGNDITMPGMLSDKKDILNALCNNEHPYALTRADLQQCAVRILGMILKLV